MEAFDTSKAASFFGEQSDLASVSKETKLVSHVKNSLGFIERKAESMNFEMRKVSNLIEKIEWQ